MEDETTERVPTGATDLSDPAAWLPETGFDSLVSQLLFAAAGSLFLGFVVYVLLSLSDLKIEAIVPSVALGSSAYLGLTSWLVIVRQRERYERQMRERVSRLETVRGALSDLAYSGASSEGEDGQLHPRESHQQSSVVIKDVAESALAATAELAESELSREYEDISRKASARSTFLQLAALVILAVSFGLAYHLVSGLHGDVSTANALARWSVSIPGAVIFAYLTSEASAHRRMSTWATQVAVQLKSVSAYVNRLDDESRNLILRELGLKVFVGSSVEAERHEWRKRYESSDDRMDTALRLAELLARGR